MNHQNVKTEPNSTTYDFSILLVLVGLTFYLTADTLTGFLEHKGLKLALSPSQIWKFFILGGMLVYIAKTKYEYVILALTYFGILVAPRYIDFLGHEDLKGFLSDIVYALKYSSFFIAFIWARTLFTISDIYLKKINQIFIINFIVLALNLFGGVLGYGYSQYGNIGSVGYFIAGNEISGLIIIVFGLILNYFFKKKQKYYLLACLMLIVLSLLKSTKVAIAGTILLTFLIPYFSENLPILSLSNLRKKILMSFLVMIPFLIIGLYFAMIYTGLWERIQYFYTHYDFLTFLLSGRNKYVEVVIEVFESNFSVFQLLFGKGYFNGMNEIRLFYGGVDTISEIDIVDLFYQFGFVGLILVFSLWFYFIKTSYQKMITNNSMMASAVFIINILLFLISFPAGHILYSGIAGILIGIMNGIQFVVIEKSTNKTLSFSEH